MLIRRWMSVAPLLLLGIACRERVGQAPADAVASERLVFQQRWKIGSAMSGDEILTRVGKVLIGPGGGIVVSQPMQDEVRVFNADGTPRGTVGRRGEGPGEFRWLGPIGLRDDTLWVASGGRLDFLSLDGKLLISHSWTPAGLPGSNEFFMPSAPEALEMASDGSSLDIPGSASYAVAPKPGVATTVSRAPVLRIDPQGEIADTVAWWVQRLVSIGVAKNGKTYTMQSPFDDSDLFGLLPDGSGVVVVRRSGTEQPGGRRAFRISVVRGLADTVWEKSMSYDPIRLSDQDIAWALRKQGFYPADDPAAPDTSEFRSALEKTGMIPEYQSPVTALALGQDGSIWLRREERAGRPVAWLELGPTGATRGVVTLPADQSVVAAKHGVVVTLERDSLDVSYLVGYRLTR